MPPKRRIHGASRRRRSRSGRDTRPYSADAGGQVEGTVRHANGIGRCGQGVTSVRTQKCLSAAVGHPFGQLQP